MLIMSSIEIPVPEKDSHIVLPRFLKMIQGKVLNHDEVTIRTGLMATSNPGVIALIANALPEDARGFSYGYPLTKTISAKEFLETVSSSTSKDMSKYIGDLTDYFDYKSCMNLLKSLLKAKPGAIRSTSFDVMVSEINWGEGLEKCRGSLTLGDSKVFGGKKRFVLIANIICPGENKKSPEVKEFLKLATEKTGFNFIKGKLAELPDPEVQSQVTDEEQLAWNVCFDEVFVQSQVEIEEKKIDWSKSPGLSSFNEAFSSRMASKMEGKNERVNWPGEIKKFIKSEFPEYVFDRKDGEHLVFIKPLKDFAKMELIFEKRSFYGLGKAFTLLYNISSLDKLKTGAFMGKNIFSLFGESGSIPPCWSYTTKDELTEAIRGIQQLLQQILPVIENKISEYFIQEPMTIPQSIICRGAVSAYEGFIDAQKCAQEWDQDASLVKISSMTKLIVRAKMGPGIDMAGRLKPHGEWLYLFHSTEKSENLIVNIPYTGSNMVDSMKFASSGIAIEPNPFPPINGKWIDSTQAMVFARNKIQDDSVFESEKTFEILLELKGTSWNVSILKTNDDGDRDDIMMDIDAAKE